MGRPEDDHVDAGTVALDASLGVFRRFGRKFRVKPVGPYRLAELRAMDDDLDDDLLDDREPGYEPNEAERSVMLDVQRAIISRWQ